MYKYIKTLIELKNCNKEDGMALTEIADLFAGKWRFIILAILIVEDKRFTELQQLLPSITPRMLSKELKDLEMSGIVIRRTDNRNLVSISYSISSSARELEPVFMQLFEWAKRHSRKARIAK